MDIRLASDCTVDSIVDGPGLRTVIWTQGCTHNCKECQNPESHSFKSGFTVSCDEVVESVTNNKIQSGITFSGGDPFEQPLECAYIARGLSASKLNLWCYSGYSFEEIIKDSDKLSFLKELDVLVDGKFDCDSKDLSRPFAGSSNQRIIDVQTSLKENKVVEVQFEDIF